MGTILLIILILLLIGALPAWPHSRGLGLLSHRRTRLDSYDRNNPGADARHLSRIADVLSTRPSTAARESPDL